MYWKDLQHLSSVHFKRKTGVTFATFNLLVEAVKQHKEKHQKRGKSGRTSTLSVEDKVLLTLMYLREYRTMFHIGIDYGIAESNVCRIIQQVEQAFIQHPSLHLPGKKALTKSENTFDIVLIDVAETPIERPKKNNAIITQAKRKDIQ